MCTQNLLAGLTRDKRIKYRQLALVYRDGKTVTLDVERKVLTHYSQTNQSNVCCFCHSNHIARAGQARLPDHELTRVAKVFIESLPRLRSPCSQEVLKVRKAGLPRSVVFIQYAVNQLMKCSESRNH